MRWLMLGLLVAGCAAPATEVKPCPTGDCEAEARAAKLAADQAAASDRQTERLRSPRLINRASFDLNCPGVELVVVELSSAARGVRGCGKQASYVARAGFFDEWVLDSPVTAMR